MDVEISKIEERDKEKVCQFCLSIFEEMGWDRKVAYGLENLAKTFGGPGEIFFIAKKGETIVACVGLKKLSAKEALMKRFYVAKKFRGKGLADLLFKKIKNFAEKNGYKTIVLDVFKDNIRAKKFYRKKGFEEFLPSQYDNWPESKHSELYEFKKLKLAD